MRTRPARRNAAVAAVAALGLLALSACSSGSDAPAASATPDASASATAATDTFPVTITHAFGETTVPAEPTRVVTVSWANQDTVIALGVAPVAQPFASYGGDAEGWLPWTKTGFEALGAAQTPTLLSEDDGLPFEDIAAADPDVIVATYSGLTQEDYDTLTGIAPTIAYPEVAWNTDWKTQLELTGKALGRSAKAAEVTASVEKSITDAVAAAPELAGTSFAYLWFSSADPSTVTYYTTHDARVRFVESLGLVSAPKIVELSGKDSAFFGTISAELADTIDADVVLAYVDDEAHLEAVKKDPLLSTIPAVKNGAIVPLFDPTFILSTSAPSALSVPWAIAEYVPPLVDAAKTAKAAG